MVDEAISAVYDEAEELGAKPPNVNELVTPVQSKLRGKGLFAGKPLIQDLAGDLKHASRRRPIGARLKNKKM
jgi:hypothetical protein